MKKYDPKSIEPKWQQNWADTKLYAAVTGDTSRPKYYMLTEFPYPSGDGLHAGHVREYTLGDVISRHKRMQGYNVLYPMGYDAFGLPTENYAIKHKIRPQDATAKNIANFRAQFDAMGYSIDWDREINTTDPKYYRWTQWLFLKFYEAGLAYQAEMSINWCPKEKTGLANEEVVDGKHERCGTPVEKKLLKQWMLKITAYADRLIEGLKTVDFPPRIADQQINWIGRSEGAEVTFGLKGQGAPAGVTVYTTRPDTIFGATFLVVSPEVAQGWLNGGWQAADEVRAYVEKSLRESELQRQEDSKVKTGVDTGLKAVHPITGELLPVWVADYVLGGYGTGAIMAVPAHDERDGAFAKAFGLPIVPVIQAPRSKTALILHGATGDNQSSWIPWLKNQLEAFGYEVIAPNLPDSDHPDGAAWLEALAPYADKLNGQSLVIGHSLGAPVAEQFIAKHNLKIDKLLLVAPAFPAIDWEDYHKSNPDDPSAPGVEAITTAPVDRAALSKQIGQIIVFGSDNDRYIPYDGLQEHVKTNLPGAIFVGFKNHFHFNGGSGIKTLPEAINYLIDDFYTGTGKLINSGDFDGMPSDEAKRAIVKFLEEKGVGKLAVKYKLRDWIFSRQHYWGEPIPIVHCPKDGAVPVPADQLPVTLPDVKHYEPTETGESPLAAISDWVNTTCPKCGGPARRETDTMPNWAGSSWYYLRYMDPHNDQEFASPEAMKYWGQVDLYLGGMEHTTLHLLYSRFWHQFLYDQGLVPYPEPYRARRGQGIVLAADGRKMSKSIGNVVNPTDIIATYGADTLRLYILFMAPYDESTAWSEDRLNGASRFIYRVWNLFQEVLLQPGTGSDDDTNPGIFETEIDRATHKTIKKIHEDLHAMHFNTVISTLMEYINVLALAENKLKLMQAQHNDLRLRTAKTLAVLLAPIAPHLAEELWMEGLGETGSVHVSAWPQYDPELVKDDFVTVAVQVNGKVRASILVAAGASQDELTVAAQADPKVAAYLEGNEIIKTIVVPRKIVNFVVR